MIFKGTFSIRKLLKLLFKYILGTNCYCVIVSLPICPFVKLQCIIIYKYCLYLTIILCLFLPLFLVYQNTILFTFYFYLSAYLSVCLSKFVPVQFLPVVTVFLSFELIQGFEGLHNYPEKKHIFIKVQG